MTFFKKKINFSQFIADAISYQIEFLINNYTKLIEMADEQRVLSIENRETIKDLLEPLIVVNIISECQINFHAKLSNEDIGREVATVYGQYLNDIERLNHDEIDIKMERVIKLLNAVEQKGTEDNHKLESKFKKNEDRSKFILCSAFAAMCAEKMNLRTVEGEGVHFASFKLAKALVQGDLTGKLLHEVKITF